MTAPKTTPAEGATQEDGQGARGLTEDGRPRDISCPRVSQTALGLRPGAWPEAPDGTIRARDG